MECAPFPGTRGWHSAPDPPLHDCVTVGRSRSPAAQSGPLTARKIAAPPWSIQPASGAPFPRAQSAQSPAPTARGSHSIPSPPKTFSLPSHPSPPPPGAHPVGALSKILPSQMPRAAGCWCRAGAPPLRGIECANVAASPQSQVPPIAAWHRPCKARHFRELRILYSEKTGAPDHIAPSEP